MPAEPPREATQHRAEVAENVRIARQTYRLRLISPEIAGAIRPGQFVMIRPGRPGMTDPLLGRPFALYDTADGPSGAPEALDVVYLVIGRGTAELSGARPGDRLDVWGPLGNGFDDDPGTTGPVAFVAGGIGQTPFLALGRSWLGSRAYGAGGRSPGRAVASSVELFYGVRSADLAAGVGDFRDAGIAVHLATDDGSAGSRGFVTDLLAERLREGDRPSRLVGCGPWPMLAALARIAEREEIPCVVSLENHMACGFGACFSCVVPTLRRDGSTDLRRSCVEGPIFRSGAVAW